MKRFLLLLLFAIAIHSVKCKEEDDLECKAAATAPLSKRLKTHLFCEYDFFSRPIKSKSDTTTVDIRMVPRYVEFAEAESIVYLHTWLAMSWPDFHLTWEPSKWDDVKEIHVRDYEIWKPDLAVFNAGDMKDTEMQMTYGDCLVTFNGTVKCVLPAKLSSHCPTDYSEWPYDKHNCTLQIGAWMFHPHEIVLQFQEDGVLMHGFMPNKQWDIHIEAGAPEYVQEMSSAGDFTIFVTIMLQRHASRLAIIYILPAFVLMVLTLTVLWLDSKSTERILVACINFICHIFGIFDLHWYFPSPGSESTPKILTFYEISVALAALALILTCLLRKLRETTVPAPIWVISGTTLILNSPIGTLLRLNVMEHKKDAGILEDAETDGQTAESAKNRTWQELANILEWFTFVISFLVYLILLTIILPPGPPPKRNSAYWL